MLEFENYLRSLFPNECSKVQEAELYSLLAGGKRFRPRIVFSVMSGCNLPIEEGFPIAAAIEMIHTYSLIHDDLPAMDDDDYRRGKLTCHKAFDEATAILAGDALLTKAFEVMSSFPSKYTAELVTELAKAAGEDGMILGQIEDMMLEHAKDVTIEQLRHVHRNKTGQLLSISLVAPAIYAGKKEDVNKLKEIGELLGLAYQIQDDIFDVTKTMEEMGKSMSDFKNHKATYVTVLGLEKAQTLLQETFDQVFGLLNQLQMNSSYIRNIILEVQNREN
ncbi:MAG: polyprenyl synthetase family protein [Erysipelotrichaceae bacterium]|nr:polyprenyl synthetase family protein [Erysipelotrichaceae bacterium]